MTVRTTSLELLDAEFVTNIRSELEDCIDGLEHQLLRLEILEPKKRNRTASIALSSTGRTVR